MNGLGMLGQSDLTASGSCTTGMYGSATPHYTGPEQRHPEDTGDWTVWSFADGTPTSVYDDGNWKRYRDRNCY